MTNYYGYSAPHRGLPWNMLIAAAIALFALENRRAAYDPK